MMCFLVRYGAGKTNFLCVIAPWSQWWHWCRRDLPELLLCIIWRWRKRTGLQKVRLLRSSRMQPCRCQTLARRSSRQLVLPPGNQRSGRRYSYGMVWSGGWGNISQSSEIKIEREKQQERGKMQFLLLFYILIFPVYYETWQLWKNETKTDQSRHEPYSKWK